MSEYPENSGQHGELVCILDLLEAFDIPRTCVEFGAYDGITNSNTHALWARRDFQALLIEPDADRFKSLESNIRGYGNVSAFKGFVTPETPLSHYLKAARFPDEIGVLSIDIDANDIEIFEALDHEHTHIVVVEFNQQFPVWCDYRDPPGHIVFRHSARALMNSAFENGYGIADCIGPNLILLNARRHQVPEHWKTDRLEEIFDYAHQKKVSRDPRIIGSKFTTNALAYSQKPTVGMILNAKLRQFVIERNYRRRGIAVPTKEIPAPCRERLLTAGLFPGS